MDAAETVDIVEPWLWSTLSTDATLLGLVGGIDHISGTLALEELPLPYAHFSMESSRDIQNHQGGIIAVESIYLVKAVGAGASWDQVRPITARIKTLLHRPNEVIQPGGSLAGLASLTSIRERVIQYAEVTEGVQYRHLGGQYRIRASRNE